LCRHWDKSARTWGNWRDNVMRRHNKLVGQHGAVGKIGRVGVCRNANLAMARALN
jgi:hypothetical protein